MLYKYVKREITYPNQRAKQRKTSRTSKFIATICLLSGSTLILYSVFPNVSTWYRGTTSMNKFLLTPSYSGTAINAQAKSTQDAITSDYTSNVNKNFSITNQILNISENGTDYSNIQGEMKLSIEKLSFKDLPVRLNVNSFNEKDYLPILEKSLAHFRGTSLPDKPGNVFIYGHSTNEIWAKSDKNNPKYAFTFLGNLDIGDEIKIEYSNKKYTYSVQKIKIVDPSDLSPVYSSQGSKSLTLMTCWVPGVGNDRLIVQAKLVEEKEI